MPYRDINEPLSVSQNATSTTVQPGHVLGGGGRFTQIRGWFDVSLPAEINTHIHG